MGVTVVPVFREGGGPAFVDLRGEPGFRAGAGNLGGDVLAVVVNGVSDLTEGSLRVHGLG